MIYPGRGADDDETNQAAADIGYAIAVEYWGEGIATKALKMAIPQIFNHFPEIVKLQAFVFLENKASHRVLEKAGFVYQGSITHQVQINGDAIVVVYVVYTFLSTDKIPPTP
ncbi:uncharacterized protein [Nicotiana sylvestris]|uniref:uncharacterized protein n=1 Tax=Nicotiana sylvestris TaxID=4096 RepID=UPI00388C6EA9